MELTSRIPEGWEELSIFDLADRQKAQFDDGDWVEAQHITNKGVRLIQTGNIGVGSYIEKDAKKYIYEASFVSLKCKPLEVGDLLICRLAEPAGRACILPDIGDARVITSVDVSIFRPDPQRFDRGYLVQYLSTPEWFESVVENVGGTTHKRISRSALGKIKVPIPTDKSEQSAIATALGDVDALLAAQDALIAKKRAIKQGAMQELLTGKRRLPGFSGEWAVNPLGEIAAISKGEQLHSSESDDSGIYPHYNGGMEPSGFTAKFNTPAFTIAISEGGNSCGYVQRIGRPFWCGGHCYAVVPKTIDNGFLFHALKGRQSEIMGLRVGSGLPNVQKAAIKAYGLRFPSETAEQIAISDVLSEMDSEITALESIREKTAQVKQGMMQALLTGRIRLV